MKAEADPAGQGPGAVGPAAAKDNETLRQKQRHCPTERHILTRTHPVFLLLFLPFFSLCFALPVLLPLLSLLYEHKQSTAKLQLQIEVCAAVNMDGFLLLLLLPAASACASVFSCRMDY